MFKTALQSILQLLSSSSSSNSNSTKRSTGNQTALHNSSMNHHNHTITMKLAKRAGFPCLCLSVTSNQTLQHKLEQNHSVPIKVMRTAEMQYHLPPRVSQPDVQLELPSDLTGWKGSVRTVVERLKSISPHVFVEGSMTGDLVLRIEGILGRLFGLFTTNSFHDLRIPSRRKILMLRVCSRWTVRSYMHVFSGKRVWHWVELSVRPSCV